MCNTQMFLAMNCSRECDKIQSKLVTDIIKWPPLQKIFQTKYVDITKMNIL
jgi:hypothetical protein